jgi:hypothetical protein
MNRIYPRKRKRHPKFKRPGGGYRSWSAAKSQRTGPQVWGSEFEVWRDADLPVESPGEATVYTQLRDGKTFVLKPGRYIRRKEVE